MTGAGGDAGLHAARPSIPLLEVRDLRVLIPTEDGVVRAVDGVSFDLMRGETMAIVGESGCGKTTLALALIGLLPPGAAVRGEVLFEGVNLLELAPRRLARIRGDRISMVFQDPLSGLSPYLRVQAQLGEALMAHEKLSRSEAARRVLALLETVGIPDPRAGARAFAHQLSGGMRQRVMIAMAVSCNPDILIADEPTSALDVTTQAEIIDLLKRLQRSSAAATILVTHDFGIVAGTCDRVHVMYAGRIVEEGPADRIFGAPQHPYTWGLFGSIARLDEPRRDRLPSIPGQPPSLINPPPGCRFHPRCAHRFEPCMLETPQPDANEGHHRVWCHLPATKRRIVWREERERP
ncbi:MAG: ABC transporter ATP-binding protein [Actinomycetota bacterium]